MIEIYAEPVSLYCAKLRVLLRHKQIEFVELTPDGACGERGGDFKTLFPSGTLPAMRDGELTLGDSEAIAEYLNEKYPTPAMLPNDLAERAKVRELARFHDTRLEPALRGWFAHVAPETRNDEVVEKQRQLIVARLQQLEGLLSEREALTLADCGFPITFAWIEEIAAALGVQVHWPDKVSTYRKWLLKQPAVIDELTAGVPHRAGWIKSKIDS